MAPLERSPDLTMSSLLNRRGEHARAEPFLLMGGSTLSYGEVDDQATALAASLANLGVGAGDRIAVVLPAWPEFAVTFFASARLGAVLVPLNPRATRPELRYMLRHSGAACAVTAEDAYGIDYLQLFEDFLVELPGLQHVVTVGEEELWYDDRIFQWEDLVSAGFGREFKAGPPTPDDPFAILYTSGTTGKPKGVELTERNLLHAAGETADATNVAPGDVVAGVGALHHVFGLGAGLLGTALGGGCLVLQGDCEDAEIPAQLERHAATMLYGNPTLFATTLRAITQGGANTGSLRLCLVSGAPVRDDLARRIETSFGAPLITAYSLTEAASTLAIGRPRDPAGKRLFTVGRPIAGTRVRVTADDGSELPPESVGEIRVRGPGVMRGYHRQPGATAAATDADGFLCTGDLGMVDEEGYVHLVGRREDVVIRGGLDVHPREVEDLLMAHPAIDRAVVVGVADEILGEAICACVVRVEGGVVSQVEVREWVAATLAEYKVPDLVSFMEELPLTETGKVWRQELARRVSSERLDRRAGERDHLLDD